MPRALRTPRFGAWLRKQRGANTLEEFAIKVRKHAAPLGLELDRSQIAKTEAGRIPSVPILMALARVLDVSPTELQMRIVAELRGEAWIDLIRHKDPGSSSPAHSQAQRGGSEHGIDDGGAAPARVQQQYDDLLKASNDVASVLFHALHKLQAHGVIVPQDNARARKGKSVARRASRKAG